MVDSELRESVLVVDCGSVTTRALLLDVVSGQYRFVARGEAATTGEPPWSDVTVGLLRAIGEIERITGRQIVGEHGQLIVPAKGQAAGVDLLVTTTSAAPALRTVLVGLTEDISMASIRKVALSGYTTIVDTVSLADTRTDEERIEQLANLSPDLFLIAGGTDGGASDRLLQLVQNIALVPSLAENRPDAPRVIYAGNGKLRPAIAEIFQGARLRAADNVRPQVDAEYLDSAQAELAALYEETKLFELPGAEALHNLADGGLIPTARAFGWTIQYLGEVLGRSGNIVGVDIGSASVAMGSIIRGRYQLAVRSDLGIGHHLPRLLEERQPEQIMRWLPEEVGRDKVADFVINKSLTPGTVPMANQGLYLELAMARELIRATLPAAFPDRFKNGSGSLPTLEMIFGSGAVLTNTPRPGQAALVLLDALQPTGLCTLALDSHGMAPSLGAVAAVMPEAAVQIIESGAFRELGNVVAPAGRAEPGEVVLNLKMIYENSSELEVEVEFGSLEVLPLAPGHQAELQLRPLKRFDVGAGPGRGYKRKIYGGMVGVIIDARGRPLVLPADDGERRAKMQQWLWDMGG
jgi:hypothetical protein